MRPVNLMMRQPAQWTFRKGKNNMSDNFGSTHTPTEIRVKREEKILEVDFDDGHCPSLKNQLAGWYNIYRIVRTRDLSKCPLMVLRPRALNMTDGLVKLKDDFINGGLLDFALIAYHNACEILQKSPSFEKRHK